MKAASEFIQEKILYLKDFNAQVSRGRIPGAYVFAGGSEEDYTGAVKQLKANLLSRGFESFNYTFFSGRESSAEEIITAAKTTAMGQGGRLVVLREPKCLTRDGLEKIIDFIGNPEPGNCLVVIAEELDRRDRLIKKAADLKILVDFRLPRWARRGTIIDEYFRKFGVKADQEVIGLLESTLPDDRGIMNRELEKLVLSIGDRKNISLADLEHLLVERGSAGIYDLADSILQGNSKNAIEILDKLLEEGNPPYMIVGFLARQYRMLLMARTASLSNRDFSEFGELKSLHPKTKEKLLKSCGSFSQEDLVAAILKLRNVDRLLKSTSISPSFLLESFLSGNLDA